MASASNAESRLQVIEEQLKAWITKQETKNKELQDKIETLEQKFIEQNNYINDLQNKINSEYTK